MLTIVDLIWFAAEMAVYAAVVYWGWTRSTWPRRIATIVGGLAVFAGIWGAFCAPQATYPLHGTAKIALQAVWFLGGAVVAVTAARR
ncbi:DUF2568 domain-containing protein [Nonomuraea sp. NPDC050556]|uniref:DUF2568 domain-containing protein n=1 Tax=Nonomuraea sp. NPDC050556 TaxID=3364369 RepID=UPI0037B2053B